MGLSDSIKKFFNRGSKEITRAGTEISARAEEMSKEGLDFAREKISLLGEKATDVTNLVRYKIDLSGKEDELASKYKILGELGLIIYKAKDRDKYSDAFNEAIAEVTRIRQEIDDKNSAYEKLIKRYSNNYEVKKLTDDLGRSDALIAQVLLSSKSNMADKLLRDTLLPKEALISVVKRGEEVIIPDGNTKLHAGDLITVIGKQDDVEKLIRRLAAE